MNQLAKREPSAVVDWEDPDMISFIRGQFGKELTDPEWELFKGTSIMTEANPVIGDIYAIKYKGKDSKMAIVFDHKFLIRKVNEKFGDFQGFTLPEYWDGERWVPVWNEHVTTSNHESKAPIACKIGVKRKGYSEPAYSQVLWRERVKIYSGKLQAKWASDPIGMLTKCTKVQSLRDSYGSIIGSMIIREEVDEPADVEGMRQTPDGGWYHPDDTDQASKDRVSKTRSIQNGSLDPTKESIGKKALTDIKLLCQRIGIKGSEAKERLNRILDDHNLPEIKDLKDLTVAAGNVVLAVLMNQVDDVDLTPDDKPDGLFKEGE